MNPYISITDEEKKQILDRLGLQSVDDLFHCIPENLRKPDFAELPEALKENELHSHMSGLSEKCKSYKACFLGGGVYEHFIPSVVNALAGRSEFVTSYTPYQPEVSQGNLQAFFEYQSLICRLFGMDVSNASMYDGPTALAEAVLMAGSDKRNRNRCLIAGSMHPFWINVVKTYLSNLDYSLEVIPSKEGVCSPGILSEIIDESVACVAYQQPNFFGCLEEMHEASRICHEKGALFIAAVDPISLGILSPPGEYEADIAVAEGQPLGLNPYMGGETLGVFACRDDFLRKMPGRLVGLTRDQNDKPGYVLTLQTREQHIRREKATSNICTNHALNAIKAAIYLSAMGPTGLKEAALACRLNIKRIGERIERVNGLKIRFSSPCFKEITIQAPGKNANEILCDLRKKGIAAGPSLGSFFPDMQDCFLLSATELITETEIDLLIKTLESILKTGRS